MSTQGPPITFSASGSSAADIQGAVDDFRTQLGALNPNEVGSFGSGRREINWDGVPDAVSAPNNLPPDFFNVNSPRGVVFSTPGSGFQVSANEGVAPVNFGNIDPSYSDVFTPFSEQRLFTALDSNTVFVDFFVAGTGTDALTQGFGAVFSDVDLAETTSMEYFDGTGASLGSFFAPAVPEEDASLSFLGVLFTEGAIVSQVEITNGNSALGLGLNDGELFNDSGVLDLVVMDDFIYGEPVAAAQEVPEPSTFALMGLVLAGLFGRKGMAHIANR